MLKICFLIFLSRQVKNQTRCIFSCISKEILPKDPANYNRSKSLVWGFDRTTGQLKLVREPLICLYDSFCKEHSSHVKPVSYEGSPHAKSAHKDFSSNGFLWKHSFSHSIFLLM